MSEENEHQTRRERIRRVIENRNNSHSSSRFDTSDVIQDTEYQLWQSGIDSLDSEYSKIDQALLATISRGTLAKKLRDHAREKRNSANDRPLAVPVESHGQSPSESAEIQELADFISQLVSRMEELDQRIYFLRFHCGSSFAEIETEVGLTRRQLATRFSHLKSHIRKGLENKRYDEQ